MRALTLLLALSAAPLPALAQTSSAPSPAPAPPQTALTQTQGAAQAAAEARDLVTRARAAYPKGSANIDQPLWKQAAAAAERAVQAAPTNPDYLRLRAQIYTEVGFWRQAELAWQAYFQAAPNAAQTDAREAASVQYNLGYAAFTRGQLDQAAAFFARCLTLDARNAPCASWAARAALEQGDFTQAQTLYDRALALKPGDATLTYFRRLAGKAAQYGPEATRAFSRAYADLDAGRRPQALAGFQEAARRAPTFAEAHREAGRLALALGDLGAAQTAYAALGALPGATDADRYNLALVQEAGQYGLPAVQTFRAAYARYAAGDRAGAEAGFTAAATQNPRYAKAWAWLGRVRFEAGNFAGAAEAYAQAVKLDPADKSSAYQLRLAEQKR
ncbi:tetratricopeptide repeat protein [Deinococcus multiflagellatus]|uniref:Tetratricopeptide repeat protein n=1 Tax=Deinococcus multiflagellatus TaxID=1656887 RepID=A0ABW1ZNJ0_9DEIO|nr:tetratricopeptide repeat protein [Deinococcus multiflagellatus]MBZ9714814.1 tetratricopeptide repeat protein [Deinococcus multiflagellatus]